VANYFAAELNELDFPNCFDEKTRKLKESYKMFALYEEEVSPKLRKEWEQLRGKKWNVIKGSWIMFITDKAKIISTMYITYKDTIGTFHAAFTYPEYRSNGFYKFFAYMGMSHMISKGVTRFEVHTDKEHLWNVWLRLGFHRTETINKLSQSL